MTSLLSCASAPRGIGSTRLSANRITSRLIRVRAANPSIAPTLDLTDTAYAALSEIQGVFLVSSQEEVKITDMWRDEQQCVVVLGRSMG